MKDVIRIQPEFFHYFRYVAVRNKCIAIAEGIDKLPAVDKNCCDRLTNAAAQDVIFQGNDMLFLPFKQHLRIQRPCKARIDEGNFNSLPLSRLYDVLRKFDATFARRIDYYVRHSTMQNFKFPYFNAV